MKFKAIWKDTFREIGKSKMRFLAIMTIILLGVAFYVGISATGPDMVHTSEEYYSDLNLMDYKVQSTYGLTEDDIDSLEDLDGMSVQSHYAYDFLLEDATSIRLYSLDTKEGQEINQYYIVDGRLPNKKGEIAIDHKKSLRGETKIGDRIQLDAGESAGDPDEHLDTKSFKIVGFVNSPLFVEIESRGVASVGSGTLNAFGVISEEDYTSDIYTEAYLKLANSEKYKSYSDEYEEYVDDYFPPFEKKLSQLENRREKSILNEAQEEIDDGWSDIKEAEQELVDAESELEDAQTEIEDGWKELEDGKEELRKETKDAQNEINKNEQKLRDGAAELENNKNELIQKKEELQKEQANLNQNEKELLDGISQIESAIPEVNNGINKINENLPELKAGIETVQTNQLELKVTKENIKKALELPEVNHKELKQQIKQIENQIDNLEEQVPIPEEEIKELQSKKAQLEQALQIPEVNHDQLKEQLSQVENGLTKVAEKEKELKSTLKTTNTKKQELEKKLAELEQQLAGLEKNKKELTDGKEQIKSGLNQINVGIAQIKEKEIEIQEGFNEIAEFKNILTEETTNAQKELDDAEAELEDAEVEYQDGLTTFEEGRTDALEEIKEGKEELQEAEEDLDKLAMPNYQSFDRSDNFGYLEYKENADRLSIIAKVFPVFFFLIAIFISFTTMTRMVDEEREYIGIMKAMGYKNPYILIKFIVYAAIATLVGSVLGLIIGYTLFPNLIFFAYASMYNFPDVLLQQYTFYTLVALIFAFVSTVGASLLAVQYSLRSNAARLLQAKPPKKGSRIWLEKINFIWDRLSFNYKITFRNVFRYKSRMLMTIIGIAGSTGLILTGFGISDSIGDILDIQYGEINKFQAYVAMNPNADSAELEDYRTRSENIESIDSELFILQKNVHVENEEMSTQDITFFVPENPDQMEDFVRLSLAKNNEESYLMDDSGAYITNKMARLLNLEIGDEFEVLNSDDEPWSVNVAGVVENYIGHLAYMTPEYYSEITGENFDQADVQLINYNEEKTNTDELGSQLMEEDAVAGIQYVDDIYDSFEASLESLDLITQILIISAAALAFIVLYNLTNINVSERSRELSTIKVLGSYDYEVTTYIYRENIILTFLGIAVGLGFGKILTNFIMETMEIDMLVFGRNIYLSSYFYASLLTIAFTLVVMAVIHFQLKKIDMVEALKGND